uniref:Phospholipase B-like n=1 Tax=Panagrellus redivivus TaxID=6233 RepID=A0A7E4W1Z7_PANRE
MRSFLCIALVVAAFAAVNGGRHNFRKHLKLEEANDIFDEFYGSANEDDRPEYRRISVCAKPGGDDLIVVNAETCDSQIAIGRYRNDVNKTGWGVLEIETFPDYPEQLQAFAAGVAEGQLTKLQIYYHYQNTVRGLCDNQADYCKKLYRYLQKNLDWIRKSVLTAPKDDVYWKHVNLTYTQLTGVFEGYRKNPKANFTANVSFMINPILMLQLSGELIDLNKALNRTFDAAIDDPEPSKCSGFIKIANDNKDLFISHVSMSGYNTMNRILKLYKFGYDKKRVPGHTVSFSGYPGALASADDYNLISSGLASIETTISVFNESLYGPEYVKAEGQLHCWVRSFISNQLARTGEEWVNIFKRYNSGTYNNQWTVLNYNLFKPGKPLPKNDVLWILEQLPGYTSTRDMTWFLEKFRYWPSYNIPYLKSVNELSGFDTKGAVNNWWRWGYSPRAKMFHRDHQKVQDLDSLRALMRYNDYTHDELSKCNCSPPYTAEASISTRGDLNPANGTYEIPSMGHRNHGSLDYKGTNYELFTQLRFEVVGGPTYDPLPPFNWNTTDIVAPHFGQPTIWNFKPYRTEWEAKVGLNL